MLFHSFSFAQNSELLKQLKNSEIIRNSKGNCFIFTELPKTEKQYLKILFYPQLHLQKQEKGINNITLQCIAQNLKEEFADSIITNSDVSSDEYSVTIFFDSINSDFFFDILKRNIDSSNTSFSNLPEIKRNFIYTNFVPQLPPYEYIKQKNAKTFYTENHPNGEQFTKQGITNITAENCKNYYNKVLLPAKKHFLVGGKLNDSIIKKRLLLDFNKKIADIKKQKEFSKPKLPEHNTIYFYENPTELISEDTYLTLIYTSEINIDEKNYALLQFTNYITGAFKKGLLYTNLITKSNIAEYSFSEMSIKNGIFEHTIGLILLPNKLTEANKAINSFMDSLINEPITKIDLIALKNNYNEQHKLQLKEISDLIPLQEDILKYNLPVNYFFDFYKLINKTSAKEIQRFAKKHLHSKRYTITVFGKKEKMTDQLLLSATDAEINAFDKKQKKYNHIPYGFGAQDVIAQFIKKTGAEKIPDPHYIVTETNYKFKNEQVTSETEIFRKNNKYLRKSYNKTDFAKKKAYKTIIFDGKHSYNKTKTGLKALAGTDSAMVSEMSLQFPELSFHKKEYTLTLLGIDSTENEECYEIKITGHKLQPRISYYSTKDSLKIKTVTFKDSVPESTTLFKNYKKTGKKGKKLIPTLQLLIKKEYTATSKIDSINYNVKIKNAVFE